MDSENPVNHLTMQTMQFFVTINSSTTYLNILYDFKVTFGTALAVFADCMSKNRASLVQILLLGVAMLGTSSLFGAQGNLTRTNWTERSITNVIEVRLQKNIFIDEVHTNWITETVTNIIPVQATRTVRVTEYKTNLNTVMLTNLVPVETVRTNFVTLSQTNWQTLTLTNLVSVGRVRTNFVALSQTNWQTVTLTNWTTVLVMKTNWVTQPVTNVVQIDLLTNRFAPPDLASTKPVAVNDAPVQPTPSPTQSPLAVTPTLTDSLQFDASGTSRQPNRSSVELQLKVRWAGDPEGQLQVLQWRVESEDGAILSSSQEQEFKRDLPLGRYKIEVKAQRDANSPLLAARGVVALTAGNAVMVPLASARK